MVRDLIERPGETTGEMRGDISEKLSRSNTKAGRLQWACLALYHEVIIMDELPRTLDF
jgi:hypothetical protein